MYRLTETTSVIRISDGFTIAANPDNRDWQEYQRWLAAGNTPEPYVPQPPTQDEIDTEFAKTYQKLRAIRDMTPQQVIDWAEANVNTQAQTKDAIKTFAVAICILARRI